MLLKRNLLTILYSFIFVIVLGIGFLEVAQLAILETANQNIIACILVLGIAIYLIAAFFIKESRYLQFFQKSSLFSNLLEGFFALFICGTMFFLNMERGADNAFLIVIMLACIYACSRLLGGRLCGSVALAAGFFFLLSLADSSFDSEEYINSLCFLIPYAAFLLVTKIIVKKFAKKGFILFCSYLFLAVLFALAAAVNPFVCALLAGCVCALIFGTWDGKQASKMTNGPIAAAVFAFLTAGVLLGYKYFLTDLSFFPDFHIDSRFLATGDWVDLLEYCLMKYTRAMQYIYRPFTISFFPAAMMFLGCLSGYYAIRKKASGIGPLCLAYIILLAYYMACNELGTHFYYLTFFLPVFASYGITNTLVPDDTALSEEPVPEQIQQQKEQDFIPEAEPIIQESLVVQPEEERPEPDTEQIQPVQREIQEDISLIAEREGQREEEVIPEWTISQEYISSINQQETELLSEDSAVTEQPEEEIAREEEIPLITPDSETVRQELQDEEELQAVVELSADDKGETDMIQVKENEEDTQLDYLLERLDISENIRRMQESATEDMADVIEREEEREELLTAIPADEMNYEIESLVDISELAQEDEEEPVIQSLDSEEFSEPSQEEDSDSGTFHSLPKYVKPDFDFSMEPMSQSLSQSEPVISEYDRVPTINDLERKWRELNETAEPAGEMTVPEPEPPVEEEIQPDAESGFAYSLEEVSKALEEEPKQEESEEPEQQQRKVIHCEEVVKHTPAGKRSYHRITLG